MIVQYLSRLKQEKDQNQNDFFIEGVKKNKAWKKVAELTAKGIFLYYQM